ncbi:hypothetical protein RI367_000284 [Sorochytrium milnesiophthora]
MPSRGAPLGDVVMAFRKLQEMSALHISVWEGGDWGRNSNGWKSYIPPLQDNRWYRQQAGEQWMQRLAPSTQDDDWDSPLSAEFRADAVKLFQRFANDYTPTAGRHASDGVDERARRRGKLAQAAQRLQSLTEQYNSSKSAISQYTLQQPRLTESLSSTYERYEQLYERKGEQLAQASTREWDLHSYFRKSREATRASLAAELLPPAMQIDTQASSYSFSAKRKRDFAGTPLERNDAETPVDQADAE